MKYEYAKPIKIPKIHIVSDKDGRLYIRKNTHIDSQLAQKLTEISCPRIVKFIEFGEDDKGEYVIEEYVEGVTAAECSFTRKQAVRVLLELCDALEALHSAKIVHRDIKPSNMIITTDGHIKLIDFDAARIEKVVKDKDTQILGTEGFAPPEQFGFSQTDSRSDIYSFGVTMNMILGENSAPFINIIKKCKALDPNDRYDSISKVKTAIRLAMLKRFAAIPAAALLLVIFTVIFSTVLKHRDQADHIGNSYLGSYISSVSDTSQPLPADSQSESGNESDNSSSESNSKDPPDKLQTSQSSESPQSSQLPQSSEPTQSSQLTQSLEPAQSSEPTQFSEPAQSSEPTQSSEPPQSSELPEVVQPPESSNNFYHTVKNENGYYNDECDYVFNDDPAVYGSWEVIGALKKEHLSELLKGRTDLIYDGAKSDIPEDPERAWIKRIDLLSDGSSNINVTFMAKWTRGYIVLDYTDRHYVCELFAITVNSTEYLLIEKKTGDYIKSGVSDAYFIYERSWDDNDPGNSSPDTSDFTYTTYINDKGEYEDACDYSFTDDPELHGAWKVVGLINSARYELWLNGNAKMTQLDSAWLTDIKFYTNGSANINKGKILCLWRKGYLIRNGSPKTVSALSIVNVNGTEYLTIENKNGDYSRAGSIRSYLIYTRAAD